MKYFNIVLQKYIFGQNNITFDNCFLENQRSILFYNTDTYRDKTNILITYFQFFVGN